MSHIDALLSVMEKLRDPVHGCPWDKEQTYHSLVPNTIEEAYEVADAIAQGDFSELRAELGDLLFQVVFYAQIAREEGRFQFEDVVAGITEKMIRRHPHVFADTQYADLSTQLAAWEQIKASEKKEKPSSALDNVPLSLPGLTRAIKLQQKAAQVGFDWNGTAPVLDKIVEEISEIRAEIVANAAKERIADELGDILFACANLARHLDIDPESALRGTHSKFERRFRKIEGWLAEKGKTPSDSCLDEMDALWERAKREE